MPSPLQRIPLEDFSWSEVGSETKYNTKAPTNIHLDLLAAGLISDPFIGMNEKAVQWVHEKDWVYTCAFSLDQTSNADSPSCDLVFEGLDTFANVSLNGHEILKSTNMFVPHRVDVGAFIRFGNAANSLEIVFESAYRRGELLRKERGDLVCWNGHPSRVYVRKAQYHYGWDWGPSLITCGPWKPIFLEVYNLSISDVKVETSLSEDLKVGRVRIDIEIRGKKTHLMGRQVLKTELRSPQGDLLHSGEYSSGSTQVKLEIGVDTVQLWNPYPSTEQPLYHLEIQLHEQSSSAIIDRCSKNIGFRRVELIQDPLAEGSTFYFKINNIPTFMGGSNWIPGDNFLTHMTPNRYTRMLDLVVRGNQNMLRVWGGGIYEDDAFYDECDRRGILVWQDFCFACGQYPSDKEFVDSIKAEAIAALKRLRSHPSLAILVGNNEDYQLANEELHHDMSTPEDAWLKTSFGARRTYESILPALVKEYAPWIPYWPGSPFGGEDNNSDRRVGDVHIWNVSAGMLLPYQRYPEVSGRFVSEFGMLSCPGMETIKKYFFGDGDDWHPQSEAFEHHCKALSYEKRMFTCLGENFRISLELEKYVYLTQLLQSEAMGSAFRGWRRKFEGRECGGALVWQTNDSWPATSWSIIDYCERPKAAYYVIARAMAPIAIGVVRNRKYTPKPNLQHEAYCKAKTNSDAAGVIAHSTPHLYPPRESIFSVWVSNSTTTVRHMTVEIRYISISTGLEKQNTTSIKIDVKVVGTTEVFDAETPDDADTVLAVRLFDENETLVSRESDWPQPLKHIRFPERSLKVRIERGECVISTDKPVKGLVLLNDDVVWSDNCLDIMPGDEQRLSVDGLVGDVRFVHYGIDD